MNLRRTPTEKRVFLTQSRFARIPFGTKNFLFHKALIAACKDKKHVGREKEMVHSYLQRRNKALVFRRGIWELIKHEHETAAICHFCQKRKGVIP